LNRLLFLPRGAGAMWLVEFEHIDKEKEE